MKKFELSAEDWAEISEQIISTRFVNLTSYSQPDFFLNAGQPGAGKTELNNLTKKRVEDDILECNADTLRDYHPDAVEILREHETDYPKLTWDVATRWNKALIEAGRQERFNIMIETTLGTLDHVLDTLQQMKKAGYRTNLQVLAVPFRWSWLGIHLRFESLKATKGHARQVSEQDHRDRYEKLIQNLPVVLASPDLDYASLYCRRLVVSPAADTALQLVTEDTAQIEAHFNAIIGKGMDLRERENFGSETKRVLQLLIDRDAPEANIRSFREEAERLSNE